MRLVRPYRTEGEGRTQSGLPHATGRSLRFADLGAWFVLLIAAAARFVGETASVGRIEPRVVVGVSAILTAALVAIVHWQPRRGAARHPVAVREGILLFAASLLVTAGAPLVVFANRSSDAPPGSVVAFWTTVFVGALLVAAGSLRTSRAVLGSATSLVLLAAGAGVLANWERPSSFSLFVRYAGPQIMMLIAGAVWVVSVTVMLSALRRSGWGGAVVPLAGGAFAGGAVLLASASESLSMVASPIVLLAAGASAVQFLMLLSLGPAMGEVVSGTAIAAAPAAITLLTVVESVVGVLGPRPILVVPVIAAAALGLAASVVAVSASAQAGAAGPDTARRWSRVMALMALCVAAVGLAAPTLHVAVRGGLSSGQAFAADFSMLGYETVAGITVFALAGMVAAAAFSSASRRVWVSVLVCTVIGAFAWFVLRPMPLHTWVSWIPPEVQQDYGTEFASLVFEPLAGYWQIAGLLIALVTAVAISVTGETVPSVGSTVERDPEVCS